MIAQSSRYNGISNRGEENMMSITMRRLCTNFFLLLAFCATVSALPGDLDTTFDGDGKTSVSFGIFDYATAVAIQPDGKIVVAGYTASVNPPTNEDLSLARFNTDGSLDMSF